MSAVSTLEYERDASPRTSLYSIDDLKHHLPPASPAPPPSPAPSPSAPSSPSLTLLFSLLSTRQRILLLLPALAASAIAGAIAPFMTQVIGQVFNAFARFTSSTQSVDQAKHALLHDVGIGALQLIGLAVASLAMSSITSCIWIWIGEHNTMAVRSKVYYSVTQKEMAWFDVKCAVDPASSDLGPVGAGGLMSKFTRETDDVRSASSLASGMIVQYLTTCVACLVLAFLRSWALTLVILSAVPALVIIQALSQAITGPLLVAERTHVAIAASIVERAITAISTVKAFNAAEYEQSRFASTLASLAVSDRKINAVWGLASGLSQFTTMAMFVQGFWFGAKLVREGSVAAGDVMSVFWACLIATSNLQMCIPQFITLTKGKFAMASLLSLCDSSPQPPATARLSHVSRRSGRASLRKIVPEKCHGEISLHDVTFSYPSRPSVPVLEDVSLYLPAGEMTFIVGGSGSGKSTIAQLLLRMYTPQSGSIHLDDQDLQFLDDSWTRHSLAAVSQECVLFDMSVHDNVALGVAGSGYRTPSSVSRAEILDACTAALIHDFVKDLPDGYDTQLGNSGTSLSGGQKQRLAIARAKLRNPPVLILDEATSALDPTSRLLVFEAMKRWRANKTTIVITHDLSQVCSNDFVYVLQSGRVAEQGYRYDLEASPGEFRRMLDAQGLTGGFLPTKNLDVDAPKDVQAMLDDDLEPVDDQNILDLEGNRLRPFPFGDGVLSPSAPRLTFGNWMFDVVADLTAQAEGSTHAHQDEEIVHTEVRPRRPSSIHIVPVPSSTIAPMSRPHSLQFSPTSPTFSPDDLSQFVYDKEGMMEPTSPVNARRRLRQERARWDDKQSVVVPTALEGVKDPQHVIETTSTRPSSLLSLLTDIYPLVPYKPLILLGLFVCLASGAMTPIFSYLLSRLLFEVSIGAGNTGVINMFGGIVLGVAALDGITHGLKYFIMETSGTFWVSHIRRTAFKFILMQDKKWFDKSDHSPVKLVQTIIKDGDDARNLISVVLGQSVVVLTMLLVGLVWALVRGWQLTLVGFAIAPIFAATMAIQSRLVAQCEARNKTAREDVANNYYEAISNVRSIRSMTLESAFQTQFDASVQRALSTGVRGAFVEGCTYGVASGLIYLAEALLFYVGAVLVSKGTYTYLQMVEVLNLVVFTVTIGSQLMAFAQKIAKSVQATHDFNNLLRLKTDTEESQGILKPSLEGNLTFTNVAFAYPERPDVSILRDFNLEIRGGECIALVGTSGSGKSTVAALMQRLYEPQQGSICIGVHDLRLTSAQHLRRHIAVVNQNPHLFDASISANIMYGDRAMSEIDVRKAARAANAHDFIMQLPQGYETPVGENASLLSGGQAQRLQIARALARPSKFLILDECTSALDSENQNAVLDAISSSRRGRTVIMVTHKVPIMQKCDRIVLVDQGHVAEQGTFDELMNNKGLFASLASGGEWTGE